MIAIIGILIALVFPAFVSVRAAARSTQCKSNLRQFAISFLALSSSEPRGAFCTGAFDGERDGSVEIYGWVADAVSQEILPATLLCPSSECQTSEKINDYFGGNTGSSRGPVARRTQGLINRGTPLSGEEVADLFNQGFNTNYASSWFMVRSAPIIVSDASSPSFASTQSNIQNLKEWVSGPDTAAEQCTAGPLTIARLDQGDVPATAIAMLGCGTRGDVTGGAGDGALEGSVGAPYNLSIGAPASESFNDGPSNAVGGQVLFVGRGANSGVTLQDLQDAPLLTEGEIGDNAVHQDTRDMRAYHQRGLNVVFADGSVRSFVDTNNDGFINPGFGVDPATASTETTGYLASEVEVSSFDWFTGTFLNDTGLEKQFD